MTTDHISMSRYVILLTDAHETPSYELIETLRFIIAIRGTGSRVPVSNLSAELLGGSVYIIRGRAQPGTTIRIVGRETLVPTEGSFQLQITAPAGTRDITVDAEDPRGNSSQYRLSLGAG